jgi:hypothetical protein
MIMTLSIHPSINQSTTKVSNKKIVCSHDIKAMVENNLRCKCGIHAVSSRPSTMAGQIIAGIEVKCINHETGCNERMTLGKEFSTLANHLKTCKGATMNCYQCGLLMVRGELDHLSNDCPFRWVTCQRCNRTMMSCQMDNHLITQSLSSTSSSVDRHTHNSNNSDNGNDGSSSSGSSIDVNKRSRIDKEMVPPFLLCKDMIICPNGCSSTIPRQTIGKHDEMCPFAIISCSICSMRCTRSSMIQHMNDNTQQHLTMVRSKVDSLTKENEELRTRLTCAKRISFWYDTKLDDEKEEKNYNDNGVPQYSDTKEFGGLKWYIGAQWQDEKQDFTICLHLHDATEAQLPVKVQSELHIGHGRTAVNDKKGQNDYSMVDGYPDDKGGRTFAYDEVMATKDDNGKIYIECVFAIIRDPTIRSYY